MTTELQDQIEKIALAMGAKITDDDTGKYLEFPPGTLREVKVVLRRGERNINDDLYWDSSWYWNPLQNAKQIFPIMEYFDINLDPAPFKGHWIAKWNGDSCESQCSANTPAVAVINCVTRILNIRNGATEPAK